MSYLVVKGILKEELARLRTLARKYRLDVVKLPKGSISIKQRGNRRYAYLVFRQGDRVVSKYIGLDKSDKVLELTKMLRLRRVPQRKLQSITKDISKIEKLLKIK